MRRTSIDSGKFTGFALLFHTKVNYQSKALDDDDHSHSIERYPVLFLSTLLTMGALLFVDKFIHPIYEVVILPSNMLLFFSQLHDVMKAPLVVVTRQHQFKVLQLREQYIWHFVHEVLKLQH